VFLHVLLVAPGLISKKCITRVHHLGLSVAEHDGCARHSRPGAKCLTAPSRTSAVPKPSERAVMWHGFRTVASSCGRAGAWGCWQTRRRYGGQGQGACAREPLRTSRPLIVSASQFPAARVRPPRRKTHASPSVNAKVPRRRSVPSPLR
jgi:hypothetical protein